MFEVSTYDIYFFKFLAANQDHTLCDAFVIAILSHGEDGLIYATDCPVDLTTITSLLKGEHCTLNGKPKIFFIQVSRYKKTFID